MLRSAAFDERAEVPITADLGGNGKRQGIVLGYKHRDGALQSSVALWYGSAKRKHDAEATRRAISHLAEPARPLSPSSSAATNGCTTSAAPTSGSTALVDAGGTFYATQSALSRTADGALRRSPADRAAVRAAGSGLRGQGASSASASCTSAPRAPDRCCC